MPRHIPIPTELPSPEDVRNRRVELDWLYREPPKELPPPLDDEDVSDE
jgi:hypothetical protein